MANKKPTKKKAPEKRPNGRPTPFRAEFITMGHQLALLGLTDVEMASVFGVTERTINNWKEKHPMFFQSINDGKALADGKVVDRLYQRALGFEHDSEEIKVVPTGAGLGSDIVRVPVRKIYPPDTAAAIFWLKNRQPKKWREKIETGFTDADGNDRALDPLIPSGKLTFEIVQHGDAPTKPATGEGANER